MMATTALDEEKKRKALEQSGGLGVVTQAGPSLNAPWYSREYATAANMSDKSGVDLERMRAAGATGIPRDDPMRRLAAVGTLSTGTAPATPAQPSPAAKPVPSGTSLVTASQSQRGEGGIPGIPAPTTPAAPTTTNQGLGIVRMDAPGASPLFTNLPTNDPSNVGLMARRAAPSAQNVGAMDALAGRYEASTTAQAQAMIDAEQAAASRMTPGQAYLQQAQASMPSLKGMTRLQAATAQQQFQDMNRVRGDAARLDQDAARTRQDAGLGMFRAQDEASTNDLRRKSVQSELDTKAQLDAARQEYLAAGDDQAKQKAAAKKLAAFGIKDGQKEGGTWDSIVVGGGVNEQGMKVGGTAMLYNKSTGEVRPIGEQQAQAGAKPAAPSLDVYLAEMRKANPGKNLSDAELKARYEMKFGAQQ